MTPIAILAALAAVGVVLWLVLRGTPAAPAAVLPGVPTCRDWILAPETYQEYLILRGKGVCDPATGYIAIDFDAMTPGETNRNTNKSYLGEHGPAIARIYSKGGVQVMAVPDKLGATLLERLDSTGTYIGEAGSYDGPDCTEPEPMIPVNPYVGQVIRRNSIATTWDGTQFPFTSECRVHAMGEDLQGFKNCTTTITVENPDQPITTQTIYVNVFDGELAMQWYGLVKADLTVDVILAKRIAQGRNA